MTAVLPGDTAISLGARPTVSSRTGGVVSGCMLEPTAAALSVPYAGLTPAQMEKLLKCFPEGSFLVEDRSPLLAARVVEMPDGDRALADPYLGVQPVDWPRATRVMLDFWEASASVSVEELLRILHDAYDGVMNDTTDGCRNGDAFTGGERGLAFERAVGRRLEEASGGRVVWNKNSGRKDKPDFYGKRVATADFELKTSALLYGVTGNASFSLNTSGKRRRRADLYVLVEMQTKTDFVKDGLLVPDGILAVRVAYLTEYDYSTGSGSSGYSKLKPESQPKFLTLYAR